MLNKNSEWLTVPSLFSMSNYFRLIYLSFQKRTNQNKSIYLLGILFIRYILDRIMNVEIKLKK